MSLDPQKFGGSLGFDNAYVRSSISGFSVPEWGAMDTERKAMLADNFGVTVAQLNEIYANPIVGGNFSFNDKGAVVGGGEYYQLTGELSDYVRDKSAIGYSDEVGYYTRPQNIAFPVRSDNFLDKLVAGVALAAGASMFSGVVAGAGASPGAAPAAVDYSLTSGGVPSLGATSIGAGQSLSVYGTNALAGTGYSAIGSTAAGGFITGAAATSSAWLPAVSDAVSTIKNASSTASTVSKLTAGSAISMPAIKKGTATMTDYTQGIKLGQTMNGENAPMTSTQAGGGSVLTSGSTLFGMKTSTAIWLGVGILAVVGVLALSKKGK